MKIINLGRCQGKTTRLLYASEFNDMPILCATYSQKKDLEYRAKQLGLRIPEPICVADLYNFSQKSSELREKAILVDEAPSVLQAMLSNLDMHGGIKAMTLTEKEETPETVKYERVNWMGAIEK
jgi:hypothetical protein